MKPRKAEIRLRQPSQACSPQDGSAPGPRFAEEDVQTQGEDLSVPDNGSSLSSYGVFRVFWGEEGERKQNCLEAAKGED